VQGKGILPEVVVDEASGFPCIGGFQAIILDLAHAVHKGIGYMKLLPQRED